MGVKEANLSEKTEKIHNSQQSGGMGLERLTVEQISKGTGCSADFIYKKTLRSLTSRCCFSRL